MSAFGAAFAKGLAAIGGPGVAAALVAGGILVGAVGGGLAAGGGSSGQPASATGKLAVYACPASGSPLVMIQAGQKLLVTGRTADSAWLRIHFPEPGRGEAWVQASPLTVDGAVASLPVAECAPELAIGSPSIEPAMSLTAIANNPPSAAPSESVEPSPSPSPSASASAVPNTRPALASLTASTSKISYDTGDYCPDAVKRVTFRVRATDAAGVASVALMWREPGAGSFAKTPMVRTAGNARSGTWQVSLDTAGNGITRAGRLAYYAVATDTAGATRRLPVEGSNGVTVAVCVNKGPSITAVSPSSGTSIFWDPLFAGSCQTARNITATVKDSDGVKSVTLFYRKPGSSTWLSKPMNNQTLPGKWYANLDTLGDKISITGPPSDNLRWYIRAVDDTGKASQLATRTLVVKRCDSETKFGRVLYGVQNAKCQALRFAIATSASDADQPAGTLKVTFYWRITTPVGVPAKKPLSGHFPGTASASTSGYQGTSGTMDASGFAGGAAQVWAVSKDRYGGTTTSSKYTWSVGCQ